MAQADHHHHHELQQSDAVVEVLDFWVSPYAMRVKLALAAKGVPYTCIPQELGPNNKSPLLVQSNPVYKKVPVLLHNSKAVCESLIICQYVDEAFSAPAGKKDLLPKDPYLRAGARFWADFADKKVLDTLVKLIHVPAREEFGAAIQESKGYLRTLEEGALADCSLKAPFFGGADQVGFVDIVMGPLVVVLPALASILIQLEAGGGESEDGDDVLQLRKLPHLQAWLKAFGDLPLAKTILPTSAKFAEAVEGIMRQRRFPNES